MRRFLLCAALACTASCIKRIAPTPVEDRTATSGVPLRFGGDFEVPPGTQVLWDFGDGTPQQAGTHLEHAFPRAGTFTVSEIIRDKDGQERKTQATATVLRRSVPMALPADVRAALIVPQPWGRLSVHRATADRLAIGGLYDEVSRSLSEALGFDVLDAKQADANGFDPDEGVALYTVSQDAEALVLAVGTSDDARAMASVKRMAAHERVSGRYASGPFQLTEQKLDDGTVALVGQGPSGERMAAVQRYGYLYVRTAGATDPLPALKSALALAPDRGLAVDPGFLAAVRHVGSGDAMFYSRGSPPGIAAADGEARSRLAGELGSSAFSINDHPELVQVRFFTQLKNLTPQQLGAALKPTSTPPDLAARLPPHAAAYLKVSASPTSMWREIVRASGADAARAKERVHEAMGLDVEKDLLPSFTGNVGVAVYLDASSLVEAVMGEQVGSFDRSSFVVAAELVAGKAPLVEAALDRVTKSHGAGDRVQVKNGTFWRLGEAGQAALKDGVLYLAFGGASSTAEPVAAEHVKHVKPVKKSRARPPPPPTAQMLGALGPILLQENAASLGQVLRKAGVRGFDVPSQQDAWLDIAGVVKAVSKAAEGQGGMASVGARLLADRAAGLRDALFELRPGTDGAEADLWIRFPASAAPAAAPGAK